MKNAEETQTGGEKKKRTKPLFFILLQNVAIVRLLQHHQKILFLLQDSICCQTYFTLLSPYGDTVTPTRNYCSIKSSQCLHCTENYSCKRFKLHLKSKRGPVNSTRRFIARKESIKSDFLCKNGSYSILSYKN